MTPVYALQPLPKSIFLAGPTPRDEAVPTWRPYALQRLQELGFDGVVYVPEAADWKPHKSYDDQVHWEWEALNLATAVVFWVPRDLTTMPAFTTNVEFGLLAHSSKAVLGHPPGAVKMSYLSKLAQRFAMPVHDSLDATLQAAIDMTRRPFGLRA